MALLGIRLTFAGCMKYFRTYPWGLQMLLFLLLVFTMISLAQVCLGVLLPRFYGTTFAELLKVSENSPVALIHASLLTQGFFSVMMFLVPALLFANFTHPQPFRYLGINKPKKPIHLLLSLLAVLAAMPVLLAIEEGMRHIDFGASVKAGQESAERIQKAYLIMPTFGDLARTFTVMAIIPGIGEELFYRGILMRFTRQRTRTLWVPIVFSSAIFAASHANYYGMFSIFLAGVLLAVIYYLTGSIVNGMLAHICFNGAQIIATYAGLGNGAQQTTTGTITWAAGGAIVLIGTLYLLWKTRTPLPADWYMDFDRPKDMEIDKESSIFN